MAEIALKLFTIFVGILIVDFALLMLVKVIENRKYIFKEFILKISKCYEFIRQRICKKSNEVNDDARTICDGTEPYDSSSVWED